MRRWRLAKKAVSRDEHIEEGIENAVLRFYAIAGTNDGKLILRIA